MTFNYRNQDYLCLEKAYKKRLENESKKHLKKQLRTFMKAKIAFRCQFLIAMLKRKNPDEFYATIYPKREHLIDVALYFYERGYFLKIIGFNNSTQYTFDFKPSLSKSCLIKGYDYALYIYLKDQSS